MDTVNKSTCSYKKYVISPLYWLYVIVIFTSCTTYSKPHINTIDKETSDTEISVPLPPTNREILEKKYPHIISNIIEQYIALSDEEKVAQLLIIQAQNKENGSLLRTIQNKQEFQTHFPYSAGGYILFKDNIVSIEQLQMFIKQLKAYSTIAPFISIDVEGGAVNRFRHLSHPLLSTIPSARQLAMSKTTLETRTYMTRIGHALRELGINMNFAPVADIEYPRTHPFLFSRIFSDDHRTTASYVVAVATGLHDAGIISVLKHFPGHGSAAEDSHFTLPHVPVSTDTLTQKDLLPYMSQIPLGLDAIMIGHLSIPSLDTQFAPASPAVIQIAKEYLHFTGLFITDSLRMKAVQNWDHQTDASIEELLFQAGVDILLDPTEYVQTVHTLTQRFKNDSTFRNMITAKVLKTLQIKYKYNIL